MRKSTIMLIFVLCSLLGINAQQSLTLPYFQDFSSITTGGMDASGSSDTQVTAPFPTGISALVEGFNAGGALKLGKSGVVGSLTTDAISGIAAGEALRVVFKAVPWTAATPKAAKVLVSYGSQSDTIELVAATHTWPLTSADMQRYEVLFNAEATASSITISGLSTTGMEDRFFIDDLKVATMMSGSMLFENFDEDLFPPMGWSVVHEIGSQDWKRETTSSPMGTASAYVRYGSASGDKNWLISPMLKPEVGDSLSFYVKCPGQYSNTYLYVKVSTAGVALTDFTETILTLHDNVQSPATITNSWTKHTVSLSEYVGQQIYIAFYVYDKNGSTIMIDEITGVHLAPEVCTTPSHVGVSDITSNSATISWTSNSPDNIVEYSTNATFAGATSQRVSGDTTLMITNLPAGRQIYVRVKADCLAGDYSQWTNANFTTECADVDPLNFQEHFADFLFDNKKPNCWTRTIAYESSTTTVYPYVSTNQNQDDLGGALYMYTSASYPINIIASPMFSSSLSGSQLTFYVKKSSTTAEPNSWVGVMADMLDTTTFIPLAYLGASDGTTNWKKYTVDLVDVPDTHRYIAFRLDYSSSATSIYIDNVDVHALPSCRTPNSLQVISIQQNSAEISW